MGKELDFTKALQYEVGLPSIQEITIYNNALHSESGLSKSRTFNPAPRVILLAKSYYTLAREEKVEKRVWGGLISKNHSASRAKFIAIAVRIC